jgi:phospholipid-binding lipoprotein MlaA
MSACTPGPETGSALNDPFEAENRERHEANKGFDRSIVRPVSYAYGRVTPKVIRVFINNGVENLSQPRYAVNHLLQGRPGDAFHTIARFVVNSTVGIGGLFDPADRIELEERENDFGRTLHVWGAREGAYLELPILGASTQRDAAGIVVDFLIDPTNWIIPSPQSEQLLAAAALELAGDRYEFRDVIEVLLYESSDSYAAARIAYLQNRRNKLSGGEVTEDSLVDIIEE